MCTLSNKHCKVIWVSLNWIIQLIKLLFNPCIKILNSCLHIIQYLCFHCNNVTQFFSHIQCCPGRPNWTPYILPKSTIHFARLFQRSKTDMICIGLKSSFGWVNSQLAVYNGPCSRIFNRRSSLVDVDSPLGSSLSCAATSRSLTRMAIPSA